MGRQHFGVPFTHGTFCVCFDLVMILKHSDCVTDFIKILCAIHTDLILSQETQTPLELGLGSMCKWDANILVSNLHMEPFVHVLAL